MDRWFEQFEKLHHILFLGIVCCLSLVDVYVISIQVGFTIASGDQSRLFLLQVFVIMTSTACLQFCGTLH